MNRVTNELQKLKGVGEVLSRRFVEAGYDSFAKVAAAGEEGLRKVPGVNPRMLGSIVAEAGALAADTVKSRAQRAAELQHRVVTIKEQIQTLALGVRDRFRDEVGGKPGRKVEKEILRVITVLEKVEGRLETKVKKAGKGLVKAEQRLEGLAEAGLKRVGKGLKKTRKSLQKIVA